MSIFNVKLPSDREVTFKEITFMERRQIAKRYNRNEGYLLEEVMAAAAITHIDGEPIADWVGDPIVRLDSWAIPDVQFYLEVFLAINSIDEMARERAQAEAKKMLAGTPIQEGAATGIKPRALKVTTGS
jgi:hypothetical protein